MMIRDILRDWAAKFKPLFPKETGRPWVEASELMAFVLNKDRAWLVAHGDEIINQQTRSRFETLAKKRAARQPLAYLIGSKYFYGRKFIVDKNVLIPRPETEVLVYEALKCTGSGKTLFWDAGTGSGAVAISLALAHQNVIASDVSKKALRIASQNARIHKARVTFVQENLLGPKIISLLRRKINVPLIIVANLPYLPKRDKKNLDADVVAYEPGLALFTRDEGQFLNKKLLTQASKLSRPMTILLEFDPPQAKNMLTFAKKLFPEAIISVLRDQFKRKRFLKIICLIPQTSNHRS